MGIRNLAMCLVHIPSTQIPKVTDWSRVTVSERPEASETPVPETFEPIDYAAKAYTLMKYSLERYKPHTILIERQRYRSGSSSAIQEWTIRVNMLESMFHAVLHTIAQDRPNEFVVHSVSPKKVTNLWLADIQEKLNARETKMAKIAVVERILNGEEMDVTLSGQAKEISEGFNIGQRGGGLKKFDDLADSMLQGLGWWRWHVNRLKLKDEILHWVQPPKPTKAKATSIKDGVSKSRRQRKTKVAEMPTDKEENITADETVDDNVPTKPSKPRRKTKEKADHETEKAPKKKGSSKKPTSTSSKKKRVLIS
jgi:hypothetical protein